ncbi:hypothetical protein MTR67_044645, partial [Solanum verrucosum]
DVWTAHQLEKELLYTINEVTTMQSLNAILGGEIGSPPTVYSSMSLGGRSKSNEIWNNVVEKCEKKIGKVEKTNYANDKETLWGRVIEAKYEEEDIWMTKEITTPYGVDLWRSIRDLWNEIKCFFKIKCTIAELLTAEEWGFNFKRQLIDWEIPTLADFINKIEQLSGLGADEDELWWKRDEKGTYKNHRATMKIVLEPQRNSMEHALENYRGLNKRGKAGLLAKNRGRWRIVPASIWWTIWKERNSRCFESIENNMQ